MGRTGRKYGRKGNLGFGDHEMIDFKVQRKAGKRSSRIKTLGFTEQSLA